MNINWTPVSKGYPTDEYTAYIVTVLGKKGEIRVYFDVRFVAEGHEHAYDDVGEWTPEGRVYEKFKGPAFYTVDEDEDWNFYFNPYGDKKGWDDLEVIAWIPQSDITPYKED